MTEALTHGQLTGWLQFPDLAKLHAACVLARERLHLVERQPNHLTITFADGLDAAAIDLPLLSYQPLKHPLALLTKRAVAGWVDLRFAPGTPEAPRDQRYYAGGYPAYRYEHVEEVDHLLPETYRARDGIGNAASPFRSVAFAPDGQLCALAGGSLYVGHSVSVRRSYVLLLDPHTGTEVGRLYGNSGLVNALAFSADGMTLAVGDSEMGLRVYEVGTGAALASRKPRQHSYGGSRETSHIDAVQYLPDGHLLTLGGTHAAVWEAPKLTLRRELAITAMDEGPRVSRMAVHPNGRRLVCVAEPSPFRNAPVLHETGALIPLGLEQNRVGESVPGLFVDVAYAPNGDCLAVVESLADPAALYEPFGRRLPATLPQFTKQISLLDAATLQPRWSVLVADGNPQRLRFLPDGSALVTVGVEQDAVVLRAWSTTDGAQLAKHVHPWHGARGACTDLALCDSRLVVVSDDAARVFQIG
jgi:WD40 repeat protein